LRSNTPPVFELPVGRLVTRPVHGIRSPLVVDERLVFRIECRRTCADIPCPRRYVEFT
jgi:hypothetical protein